VLSRLNIENTRTFKNPFVLSEKEGKKDGLYQGFMRKWDVYDYEKDVYRKEWGLADGHRITICYNKGVLGVGVRYRTGKTKQVDTLTSYKYMYN
jgi:hypothetical protein